MYVEKNIQALKAPGTSFFPSYVLLLIIGYSMHPLWYFQGKPAIKSVINFSSACIYRNNKHEPENIKSRIVALILFRS